MRKDSMKVNTKATAWKVNTSVYESLFVYIVRVYFVVQNRSIGPIRTRHFGEFRESGKLILVDLNKYIHLVF